MKGCRPLTHVEVKRVLKEFSGKDAIRDKTIFILGVTSGFRISELLTLRFRDVLANRRVRRVIEVKRRNMKQRRESRQVRINKQAQLSILSLIKHMQSFGTWSLDTYLFKSRKGRNSPITRQQAYYVLMAAFNKAGVTGKLGTHSMRKTFGNNIYDYMLKLSAEGKAIDPFRETAKALGHKDLSNTERYLSFRDEHLTAAIDSFSYDDE